MPRSTPSSGLATAVAAMMTTVSPGTKRPTSTLVSSIIATPGEKSPDDGIDTLHGVEQPREELVHAPSLGAEPGL